MTEQALRVMPNIEALLVTFLRADADVKTAVAGRVYATELPANPVRPCVRVTRYGGTPLMQVPFELDQANVQIDVWGTTHAEAGSLAQMVRAVLSARLPGKHTFPGLSGIVTAVQHGPLASSPDPSRDPSWPRYIADLTVVYRPA